MLNSCRYFFRSYWGWTWGHSWGYTRYEMQSYDSKTRYEIQIHVLFFGSRKWLPSGKEAMCLSWHLSVRCIMHTILDFLFLLRNRNGEILIVICTWSEIFLLGFNYVCAGAWIQIRQKFSNLSEPYARRVKLFVVLILCASLSKLLCSSQHPQDCLIPCNMWLLPSHNRQTNP